MSLLMDALKRAEEAKRHQTHTQATDNPPSIVPAGLSAITLEPLNQPLSPNKPYLPDLSAHDEAVDKDLRATADSERFVTQKDNDEINREQAAAKNLFTAKTSSPDTPKSNKKTIAIIITLGCLAGIGVGAYFFFQLQTLANGSKLVSNPTPAPLITPKLTDPKPIPTPALPPSIASKTQAPINKRLTTTPNAHQNDRAAMPPKSTTEPLQKEINLSVSQPTEAPLLKAYEALQGGKIDLAKKEYSNALHKNQNDTDALLGLAIIASREADYPLAENFFSRVLNLDPRNATAYSWLISLRGNADATQTESQLKARIAAQINDANASGSLNFSLGNIYAEKRRWSEAQQAFFKAHTCDAENPDYAFNLAVSLDQLGQTTPSKKYYRLALRLAKQRSAAFDRKLAEVRLTELSTP